MVLITGTLTTVRKGMLRGLSSRQHCKPSDIKARRGPGQTQGRATNGCWSGKATKTGDPEQWVTDCKGLGGEAGENCESIPGGSRSMWSLVSCKTNLLWLFMSLVNWYTSRFFLAHGHMQTLQYGRCATWPQNFNVTKDFYVNSSFSHVSSFDFFFFPATCSYKQKLLSRARWRNLGGKYFLNFLN